MPNPIEPCEPSQKENGIERRGATRGSEEIQRQIIEEVRKIIMPPIRSESMNVTRKDSNNGLVKLFAKRSGRKRVGTGFSLGPSENFAAYDPPMHLALETFTIGL